jgi:hypothetical protein
MYMQKKTRLHLLLIMAAALGSSASVLSGTLAALDYSAATALQAQHRTA